MNKHNLGIISTLVGIALIALIAVQIYWIKSSVKLKEEEFGRKEPERQEEELRQPFQVGESAGVAAGGDGEEGAEDDGAIPDQKAGLYEIS